MSSLNRTASWIIRKIDTKDVVMETFDARLVGMLNTAQYEAVPILEYLQEVNRVAKGVPTEAVFKGYDAEGLAIYKLPFTL